MKHFNNEFNCTSNNTNLKHSFNTIDNAVSPMWSDYSILGQQEILSK